MTLRRLSDALREGARALQEANIDAAVGDARALLAHAAQIAPDRLTLHLADEISAEVDTLFVQFLNARLQRRPVAHIIGKRLFWGRDFRVTHDTLDPRPETECLIAEALQGNFTSVLDLGTGTGCIVLSLLAERPLAHGVGCDVSSPALEVARDNARHLGLSARVEFVHSDWFAAVLGQYDLIVSNPPYISAAEMVNLAPDVRLWEPYLALSPGGDGLDAYRALAAGARRHLAAGGRVLLEIGPTQGADVCALLAAQGFEDIHILPDLDGRDRVVCAIGR